MGARPSSKRERREERERERYIYISYIIIYLSCCPCFICLLEYIYICIEKMCGYIYEFRSREIDREIDRYIYM